MKPFAVLTTALGLAAGTVAGTAAYLVVAGPAPADTTVPVSGRVATVVPGTRFEWAPCRPPATLERGVCVTDVVRTVTVPGPAPSSATTHPSTGDDEQDELEPDDYAEPDEYAEPDDEAEPDEDAFDDDAYEHDGSDDHEAEDPEVEHEDGGLDD